MYYPLRGPCRSDLRKLLARTFAHRACSDPRGLRLLTSYLAVERHNAHLACWLATEEDFARQVFGADYEHLLASLFGNDRERLYLMAAKIF